MNLKLKFVMFGFVFGIVCFYIASIISSVIIWISGYKSGLFFLINTTIFAFLLIFKFHKKVETWIIKREFNKVKPEKVKIEYNG